MGALERQVSPEFKWSVIVLLSITVVFAIIAVVLSFVFDSPTSTQAAAIHWLFGLAGAAFSGMLGLFGGKAT
jgi:hypothetical protein